MVAVVQQVVGGDGGTDVGRSALHELHRIAGSDVLEHHFQGREALDHTAQVLADKDLLAVEYIDLTARYFAVYQQRQADFGHGFEHRENLVDAGHARIGVGSRAGRVELGRMHKTRGFGRAHIVRLGQIGEVQHHQRLETAAGRAVR